MNNDQKIWSEALDRLHEIDSLPAEDEQRNLKITKCRNWMQQQSELPRLCDLAKILEQGIDRQRLWSVLVPVERSVSRLRITDVDILDSDLPQGERHGKVMPVKIVVDSVRSAFNVGGILRSAECFGLEQVVLCGYSPLPDQPRVMRAALGAEKLVSWRFAESIRTELDRLKQSGVVCYALETVSGAKTVDETEWSFPCALVLGNERFGLDPDVIGMCNGGATRIELFGSKNSLNVVSAFSVAAYAVRQQWSS